MSKPLITRKFLLVFIPLLVALTLLSYPATRASPDDSQVYCDCEGSTSILVVKAASVDGSTMTSHSCDSTTDRTWMNIVPHRAHKAGELAKVYFEPKRTKG